MAFKETVHDMICGNKMYVVTYHLHIALAYPHL